jgi:tetratricopeptide (TPR) repeat protein
LSFALLAASLASAAPVKSYQGTLSIPTYEHTGRELEPPLFANSTVTGMYPFTTYLMPFKGAPQPKTYQAIFLENEYLKVTYIPDFGDRIFSVYDKLRHREMLYRNDVIKPAPYNPRNSWPQSGLELTGPHDLHTLTLHSEPYWSNRVIQKPDGSVSLVLGEIDPVYGMKVNLTATLHPEVAALELTVYCYNTRDGRKPQMFWVNTAINATPKTRFIYPMSRTVGHTTADIADWPLYNGIDYSWDRNNKHMLGVFGIDIFDNFQGAYQFDRDYGIFRWADRRIVQGMKLWTFGYGPGSESYVEGYTDQAGPYVELQSGRHVWDGHYEWVAPHKVEGWSEWWVPVSNTNGLTTLTQDVALNLEAGTDPSAGDMRLALAAIRTLPGCTLEVTSKGISLFKKAVDLTPQRTFHAELNNGGRAPLEQVVVRLADSTGKILLDYHRPDKNPGRQAYTPFTAPLEQPRKKPDEMSVEELTLAGEFQLKELNESAAQELFDAALKKDPGYSRANTLLGITHFNGGRYQEARECLEKAIGRDPYADQAYYYLAMSQLALGDEKSSERTLYYIWPESAYFGNREYHLGNFAFDRHDYPAAIAHFEKAHGVNENDLLARLSLALCLRETGDNAAAATQLDAIEKIDPTNRIVFSERWFLTHGVTARDELLRLLGGQGQEAMATVGFYRDRKRWKEAASILHLVEKNNRDPFGATPEFFYTLAYCERRAGDTSAAAKAMADAKHAAGNIDRFPYREESLAPLLEAVNLDPQDETARFDLACLYYFRGKQQEAIRQWQQLVAQNGNNFSAHRALGLAYAEQGYAVEKAAGELEKAVELKPAHIRTLDDLSGLYARAGRFDDQLAVLTKALKRSPADDDLAEGVLAAYLNKGEYDRAQELIDTHHFATRHRSYSLRDKYRVMRYGMGLNAFNRKDYQKAVDLFESALTPPPSLGVDTFASQTSSRIDYYLGRSYEALGKTQEAQRAYMNSINGIDQLSGDRDSWNAENLYMLLSLDRLNRHAEAAQLVRHFQTFAETERDSTNPVHRAQARYLLALIEKYQGHSREAKSLLEQALVAEPDLLPARLELRGDAMESIGNTDR